MATATKPAACPWCARPPRPDGRCAGCGKARDVRRPLPKPTPAVKALPPAEAPAGATAKVLTVRQPFASAILAGLKEREYRSWQTRYRGVLLIHAAARRAEWSDVAEFARMLTSMDPAAMTYSAVLGAVDLVSCEDEGGGFAWVLANPRKLAEPFPCSGKLGLWTPPAGLRLA
jgi:hypothetical protein